MNEEIKNKIYDVLHEMGFIIFENDNGDDINLQDYITDSIQFVDFIVRLEEKFDIMLADEFLDYTAISSMCGFAEMLEEFLEAE